MINTHIRTQRFRNRYRTVCVLIIFQDSGNRAAHRYAGPIQRVHKLGFVHRAVFIADRRPARLEVLEIGAGGYLHITLIGGHPDFDIVGFCGGEA